MVTMKSVWEWIQAHKAPLSYVVGVVAAGLEVKGQKEAGALVGLLATWLNGAGHVKSDSYYKE
jgi:hypothetical protein